MTPDAARRLAGLHLSGTLPRRWAHVQGVGARASDLCGQIEDGALLAAAAWLHDVGYAPALARTRFHPLDGARAVRALGGDSRLCGLIAFHSAAAHEAAVLGVSEELQAEFTDEWSLARDLLWYLDMTTGPQGESMSFEDRMADVRERYPTDHYVIQALDRSMDDRRAAVGRVETWIADTNPGNHV